MDFIDGLSLALADMWSWPFLLAFLLGCMNGMLTGLLPGLGGSVGIALMIPFTYGMDTSSAMGLFVAALAGQSFTGSITAILLNVPGSSPSAATTLDGYPLARQGRGGFAIGISASASFLGSLIGTMVLIALIPAVRSIILAFSFPEFAMLGVFGLAIIAMAARGSMLKGVISGLLGILVSFVGFAPIGGDVRYVFDQPALFNGFEVVIVLVGMFSVTEALQLLRTNQRVAANVAELKFGRRQVWEGVVYTVKQPFLLIRSSLIGTGVGLVPAVGGTVAAFLAYFQAARTSKDGRFGQGDPRGVLAPEASNDAKDSGSALPSLAFGIPGSSDWAIVLGAMVIHGVTPGPNLIRDQPDIVWIAILVLIGASFLSSALGLLFGPQLLQVTRVRPGLLSPTVLMLAVIGAYALNLSIVDVMVSLGFGLLAYLMRSAGMPIIPFILGFILGPMVERSYLQTLSTFGGLSGFVTRPISLTLVVLTVAVLVYEVVNSRRAGRRSREDVVAGVRSATRPVSIVLMGLLASVALAALVLATDFSDQGRTFPVLTASLLLALVVAYLAVALVRPLRTRLGGLIADGQGAEAMMHQLEQEAAHLVGRSSTSQDDRAEAAPVGVQATERAPEREAATSPVVEDADALVAPAGAAPEPGPAGDAEVAQERREMNRRLRTSLALTAALLPAAWFFGLPLTVPVIFVLFLRLVTRESWRTTAVTTTLVCGALYLVFVTLLGVPVEGGTLLPY